MGGNNEICEYFDVFDCVFGGRDVVILKYVWEIVNVVVKNKEILFDLFVGDEEEGYILD